VLTLPRQYAANLREVIGIGVEFGLCVLRLHLRGQTPRKKCNEYCAHSLFIHMAFSFREMRRYFIGEKSVDRMYIRSIFSTNLLASSDLIAS
jgi:hypothetical protein